MGRACEICGKRPRTGNRNIRHGLARKKGGIGLHTTGITRRRFMPNLHRVRAKIGGSVARITVCSQCIRMGKVVKP